MALTTTYNVRTLAVKERNGYGHAECVLAKARQLGCDFVGLQETRRAGKTEFSAAGYRVFCSGQKGLESRQGLHGVGLTVRKTICGKSVYTHQLIGERLISMRFELTSENVAINSRCLCRNGSQPLHTAETWLNRFQVSNVRSY